jgi:hypothetical protein
MRSPPPAVWRIEHVLHGTARGPGGSAELGEEIGDARVAGLASGAAISASSVSPTEGNPS